MKRSKGLLILLAVIMLFSAQVFAQSTYYYGWVIAGTPATLYSGRMYIMNVTLTNPASDYVTYDIYTTTATPSDNTADKVYLKQVGVDAETTTTIDMRHHNVYDFRIAISTFSTAYIPVWDGGKLHPVQIETR